MLTVNTKKDEILQRSKNRAVKVEIGKVANSDSFTTFLSPLESLELVSKISKESFFLETGSVPDDRVDKNICRVFARGY